MIKRAMCGAPLTALYLYFTPRLWDWVKAQRNASWERQIDENMIEKCRKLEPFSFDFLRLRMYKPASSISATYGLHFSWSLDGKWRPCCTGFLSGWLGNNSWSQTANISTSLNRKSQKNDTTRRGRRPSLISCDKSPLSLSLWIGQLLLNVSAITEI